LERDRSTANAVIRACEVLHSFHKDNEVLTLAQLVERTTLSKTTVFRLLQSLAKGGLVERVAKGQYASRIRPVHNRRYRIGFAAQAETVFCGEVSSSIERAAAQAGLHLFMVNNRYSPREALKNAEALVRERVDLVLEYQTYERVAPLISAKFVEANIPVIAIEIPHPGATFFGANNYQAGLIGGRALGRWANEHWNGRAEQILLLELPIAGPLPQLRMTGMLDGLRREMPSAANTPVVHLDGKGGFDEILDVVRRHLRRSNAKRTLIGSVNDVGAQAVLRGFEEAGQLQNCAVMGQNGLLEARLELRRPGSRLVGTVAYFPERYGDQLIPLALNVLHKKPTPPAVFVEHQLLTARNVRLHYPLDC